MKSVFTIPALIFCLIVLLSEIDILAQHSSYFTHNWGVRMGAERDEGYSPLNYSGVGLMLQTGFEKVNDQRSSKFAFQFNYANQRNSVGRQLNSYSGMIQTFEFYGLDTSKWLFFGWSNTNFFTLRDFEDQSNFSGRMDYFTAFGPAVLGKKRFQLLNRDFSVEIPFQWSLIGFTVRSGFINSAPKGFENSEEDDSFLKSLFASKQLYHPIKNIHFNYIPRLSYYFHNGNAIGLQYDYVFAKLKGEHTSVLSRGMWSFQIQFKLSR